mmetsp:Transcript_59126/g.183578  ORF Transcript_59126/g.183578 Transcript_59126/m.183578 type:complete len:261 (-) Transcript_59126:721-1503(-)
MKRFGVAGLGSEILPLLALASMVCSTCAGERVESSASSSATPPATCGHAMEVPLMDAEAVSLLLWADVMEEPGAKMSMQLPKLLYPARLSLDVVAATVMALGANAGEKPQASSFSLPAATTTVTPLATDASMAVDTLRRVPRPPRLALTIAGLIEEMLTQSSASMNQAKEPEPLSLRTLTARIVACLATPKDVPAMVPAQWVPWPCLSVAQFVSAGLQTTSWSESTSKVGMARPPKSWCVVRTPVSNTKTWAPAPPFGGE